jgi:hypothetical protein
MRAVLYTVAILMYIVTAGIGLYAAAWLSN